MSQDRLPPPRSEACLVRLRSSSQKGGTIVAEAVMDLATHVGLICNPDGYRPAFCPGCGNGKLHVHDYRERILRAEPGERVAKVVRHVCTRCEGIWMILPAFIARHLWRSWSVVERTLSGLEPPPGRWPPVPARTQRRWQGRWLRPAQFLVQVLAGSGDRAWAALAVMVGSAASCAALVASYAATTPTPIGQRLASVAALVYRLAPKVRLM
jgi:hypothetical protein